MHTHQIVRLHTRIRIRIPLGVVTSSSTVHHQHSPQTPRLSLFSVAETRSRWASPNRAKPTCGRSTATPAAVPPAWAASRSSSSTVCARTSTRSSRRSYAHRKPNRRLAFARATTGRVRRAGTTPSIRRAPSRAALGFASERCSASTR